ncbi:NAD(P)-binding protein [Serendipita vermifera]|nr:NAD(P)-binding protein [Serendipita vermifera]
MTQSAAKSMRRTVFITGCTNGSSGSALAKEYAANGLHVFAASRKLESMSDLAGKDGVTLVQLDVTQAESIKKAKEQVESLLPSGQGLDLLVNNAGIASTTPALDHNLEDIRMMFETNVFGIMRIVQEFFPLLILSSDACIVNIGSNAALVPFAFGSTYNASKAALHAYSDTLRVELRPFNIKVVTAIQGGVRTNIFGYTPKPLPDNSYYAPIEKIFREVRSGLVKNTTPAEVFANQLVRATLKNNPSRRLYIGAGARLMAWLALLLPLSTMEYVVARVLGLEELTAMQKAAANKRSA